MDSEEKAVASSHLRTQMTASSQAEEHMEDAEPGQFTTVTVDVNGDEQWVIGNRAPRILFPHLIQAGQILKEIAGQRDKEDNLVNAIVDQELQAQSDIANADDWHLQNRITHSKSQLMLLQQQLDNTQLQLKTMHRLLNNTQEQLSNTQQQLSNTQSLLENTQQLLLAMQ